MQFDGRGRNNATVSLDSLPSQIALALMIRNVLLDQIGFPVSAVPTLVLAGAETADQHWWGGGMFVCAVAATVATDAVWYVAGRRRYSAARDSRVAASPAWRGRRAVMSKLGNPVLHLKFHEISNRGKKPPPGAEEFTDLLKSYIAGWAGHAGVL